MARKRGVMDWRGGGVGVGGGSAGSEAGVGWMLSLMWEAVLRIYRGGLTR